jgi:hypothetical protein
LKALLNPLAKNPPKGPITEAKMDMKKACNKNGYNVTVSFMCNWKKKYINRFQDKIWLGGWLITKKLLNTPLTQKIYHFPL